MTKFFYQKVMYMIFVRIKWTPSLINLKKNNLTMSSPGIKNIRSIKKTSKIIILNVLIIYNYKIKKND